MPRWGRMLQLSSTSSLPRTAFPCTQVRACFVRGSVVRFILLPPGSVDVELLHDATRREARGG